MSLFRMLTRMAAVSAVSNYNRAPYPTLAGPNIFDSKIEPAEDHPGDELYPCVVFYTDYDKNHWQKGGSNHLPRQMSLTIELLVVQADPNTSDDVFQLSCPQTDSELETSLDVLETQIVRALAGGNAAADLFNEMLTKYESITSRRGASHEGGQRLAARQITLEGQGLRENYTGQIAASIDAYLTSIDVPGNEFQPRVAEIRSLLNFGTTLTRGMQFVDTMGISRAASAVLGYEPQPRYLPPIINYNFTGLNP